MIVHYLQHVPFEGPGYIRTWLEADGHELTATCFFEPEFQLPDPSVIDALVIMGGPMGIYDEHEYTWLKKEKDFIKECIRRQIKILGICLGAQLIADCLGARVYPAPHKEIGWYPVTPGEDCLTGTWFNQLFQNQPIVFHWHGDQFGIPAGAVNLLNSPANSNQAFLYSDHVLGLQFHLEIEQDNLENMINNGEAELEPGLFVQSAEIISAGAVHIKHTNALMDRLFQKFFEKK